VDRCFTHYQTLEVATGQGGTLFSTTFRLVRLTTGAVFVRHTCATGAEGWGLVKITAQSWSSDSRSAILQHVGVNTDSHSPMMLAKNVAARGRYGETS
jgi:L-alanine-DL-glutamate epimerase-like enolase superfamily enzyme